jgi:hypothetical protein
LRVIPLPGGGNGARPLLAAIEIAPQLGSEPTGAARIVLYVPFETILIALAHRTVSASWRQNPHQRHRCAGAIRQHHLAPTASQAMETAVAKDES